MKTIQINGLYKSYNKFTLKDVNFELHRGEVIGLIGKNGAGKTTLISSIMNPGFKDCGEIRLFGQKFDENSKLIKNRIGFVQDMIYFFREFNSLDISNIMKHIYSKWDSNIFYKLLNNLEVDSKKRVKDYSRGMKTKLQLAVALSHKAELLILDEVTSGLDPIARSKVKEILREYANNGGSILFSTHIVSDLKNLADKIILIDDGSIVFNESASLITYQNPVIIKKANELSKVPKKWIKGNFGSKENRILILNEELINEYKNEELIYPDLEELMNIILKESV